MGKGPQCQQLLSGRARRYDASRYPLKFDSLISKTAIFHERYPLQISFWCIHTVYMFSFPGCSVPPFQKWELLSCCTPMKVLIGDGILGCSRTLANGLNLLINGVYWCYFTSFQRDILVGMFRSDVSYVGFVLRLSFTDFSVPPKTPGTSLQRRGEWQHGMTTSRFHRKKSRSL